MIEFVVLIIILFILGLVISKTNTCTDNKEHFGDFCFENICTYMTRDGKIDLPETLIYPGNRIYWRNISGNTQTITFNKPYEKMSSTDIPHGGTFFVEFRIPGIFNFYSKYNKNFKGTVFVRY